MPDPLAEGVGAGVLGDGEAGGDDGDGSSDTLGEGDPLVAAPGAGADEISASHGRHSASATAAPTTSSTASTTASRRRR